MTAAALLRPRFWALRNRWRRCEPFERRRLAALGALGAGFCAGVFLFVARVLAYFQSVPELGPVLAERLLGMILLAFFSLLLFSNVVASLSTFYLSAELPLLIASPTPPRRLHAARFLETLWDSSWMIVLFGLPVFFAYGAVHRGGAAFYAALLALLPAFLVIPCALGISTTMLLVRFFPARSTREVFALLSVVGVAVLYVLLRLLQPERLVRPEAFADFLDFLAAVRAPSSAYLPSEWLAAALMSLLARRPDRGWILEALALASSAAAAFELCALAGERLHATGWSRSQEGRRAPLPGLPLWDRLAAPLPLSRRSRALLVKDAKLFFRDATQWSQLVLLGALVVVYVYNFRVLPHGGAALYRGAFDAALAFLNLALAGFVVASVAVRFLYPAISVEGRPFWMLRSAPIPLRAVWWSKFWSAAGPLVVLGVLLVVLGDRALGVGGALTAVSALTLGSLTLAVAALGLCLGSVNARFDHENAAKISTSAGGVVYMIASVALIAANVALEAWPATAIVFARLAGRPLEPGEIARIAAAIVAVGVLDGAVFAVATRIGIRRLETVEIRVS